MLKRRLHVSLSSFQHECKRATVCQLPVSNVFYFPGLCAVADDISFVCVLLWVTFWIHYQILSSPTCGRLLWTLPAKKKKNLSNMIKCIACSLWLSSKFSHLPTLYSISSLICKRNTYYTWDLFRCHCAANMWEKWHFIRLRHAIVDGMSVKCVNNSMEYSLDYHQCLIGYVACMVDLFG